MTNEDDVLSAPSIKF